VSAPPRILGLTLLPDDLSAALNAGAIDKGCQAAEEFFPDLDLIVFCTPLGATLDLLRDHRELLSADTVVTDVVSLKEPLLTEAQTQGLGPVFVGSHPMTGGEGSGFHAGRIDLYRDAGVWIVPGDADAQAIERVETLWSLLGSRTERIGAAEHDELMAWVSHLPQVLSSALGATLGDAGIPRDRLGPGGRDMTRLAGSSPEMWLDLLESAPEALPLALRALEEQLARVRRDLEEGARNEAKDLWEASRAWFGGVS
jgi:prephenate dehydrogenase